MAVDIPFCKNRALRASFLQKNVPHGLHKVNFHILNTYRSIRSLDRICLQHNLCYHFHLMFSAIKHASFCSKCLLFPTRYYIFIRLKIVIRLIRQKLNLNQCTMNQLFILLFLGNCYAKRDNFFRGRGR